MLSNVIIKLIELHTLCAIGNIVYKWSQTPSAEYDNEQIMSKTAEYTWGGFQIPYKFSKHIYNVIKRDIDETNNR